MCFYYFPVALSGKVASMLEVIDHGVTAFDCGDIYTGVERILGKMLRAHFLRGGVREGVAIHTKVVPDLAVIERGGVVESYVRGLVQRSLNRLGTEYLDLVQFHWWDTGYRGYVDAAKCLVKLREEGLVKEIGLTNFGHSHTKELLEAGIPVASTQVGILLKVIIHVHVNGAVFIIIVVTEYFNYLLIWILF